MCDPWDYRSLAERDEEARKAAELDRALTEEPPTTPTLPYHLKPYNHPAKEDS